MPRATLPSLLLVSVALFCAAAALPQGETTSAIAGQVTDATNAAIPGALVTITNRETGLQRRATADEQGRFNFPQLKPGAYSVKAEAKGFDPQQNDNVLSGLGQKQTVNFTLEVAKSQQTVEVSGEAPLINPGNANTSTNLSAPALENLPNPGGDLTYPLQFAAGAHGVLGDRGPMRMRGICQFVTVFGAAMLGAHFFWRPSGMLEDTVRHKRR